MIELDISDVIADFPAYRVALVVARDLGIVAERPAPLAAAIAGVESETLARYGETMPADIPPIKAWRDAYRAFGVKKTSYRSSVERLLRAVQRGRGLVRVNTLVDSYNAVSLRHLMPVGADDLEKVVGPLAFRRARTGDDFLALGDDSGRNDPPKDAEIVYADSGKLLCRRWNWYQDGRSATSADTRHAVLTVQSLAPAPVVEHAAEDLCAWLAAHCNAECTWAVADRETPIISAVT